jgi:hypothetical protein
VIPDPERLVDLSSVLRRHLAKLYATELVHRDDTTQLAALTA